MRILLIFMLIFAVPATAQELSSNYNRVGQMDLVVDGQPVVLQIADRISEGESFAEIKLLMGRAMLSVTGFMPDVDGEYSRPMVSFTLDVNNGSLGFLTGLDFMEAGRDWKHPTEVGPGGTLEFSNFSITDDGAVSFDFTAELTRMELDDDYNQTAEEGMPKVAMSGHVELVVSSEHDARP